MSLDHVYKTNRFVLSYELFPPKTDTGLDALVSHVEKLLPFNPSYMTCTYGAGGSTREKTLATLARVRNICDVPLASHLTCVDSTEDELRTYLSEAETQGIDHIIAIRGDAPEGKDHFESAPGGFAYASELVSFVRKEFPRFGVAVGGYPEKHPESRSIEEDLRFLKEKVDCGAHAIITQLFYRNEDFFCFRDRCHEIGIKVPIVPGILPVTNYKQVKRIAGLCGAVIPDQFSSDLESCADEPEAQFQVGTQHATHQVQELIDAGVPGIHFYVLNKSRSISQILTETTRPTPG